MTRKVRLCRCIEPGQHARNFICALRVHLAPVVVFVKPSRAAMPKTSKSLYSYIVTIITCQAILQVGWNVGLLSKAIRGQFWFYEPAFGHIRGHDVVDRLAEAAFCARRVARGDWRTMLVSVRPKPR
jgi:hypothetical protein